MDFSITSISHLIPHLFLLRELHVPSQLGPTDSDYCLIAQVNHVLESLNRSGLARFQFVQSAFATWSALQNDDALDAARLHEAIVALEPGEHLPLYVHAQNSCLIISRLPAAPSPSTSSTAASASGSSSQLSESSGDLPGMRSADGIVFSTFAPALSSKQVSEAEGELLCNYPHTSIRVERSPLLLSKAFAEQLALLHVCPIDEAAATKQRRSTTLLEVRNM